MRQKFTRRQICLIRRNGEIVERRKNTLTNFESWSRIELDLECGSIFGCYLSRDPPFPSIISSVTLVVDSVFEVLPLRTLPHSEEGCSFFAEMMREMMQDILYLLRYFFSHLGR